MSHSQHTQSGFSLVELIVALAVFAVVLTITVGALLMLVGTNQQLQGQQSMMTNLSFALDSMTREIRTGTQYYCFSDDNKVANLFDDNTDLDDSGDNGLDADQVNDCANANSLSDEYHGIAFIEGGESITDTGGRILYYFDNDPSSPDKGKIMRRIGNEAAQSIVSDGIYIENAEFFVTGTDPQDPTTDVYQPTVTVIVEAKESSDAVGTTIVQTTITQRTLDI
jgi:prepilin-type N-terminal cleavage/methylation domain-containing protein